MFRKQKHNGFKPKPNEHFTIANYDVLLDLYKIVYVHPPNNSQYFAIFLKGWLAHRNGHKVNWT
jgi:hypothetical protein